MPDLSPFFPPSLTHVSTTATFHALALDALPAAQSSLQFRPEGEEPADDLAVRLREEGLLVPPLVQASAHGLRCLSGRRRIDLLRAQGHREILCQVVREDCPPLLLFTVLIRHARLGAELSPVQQARIMDAAAQLLTREELLKLLPPLELPANRNTLDTLAQLLSLDTSIQLAVHAGLVNFRHIRRLNRLSTDDQQTVINLLTALGLGGSRQQLLFDAAFELGKRDGLPFARRLRSWQESLPAKANIPQQTTLLLNWLDKQLHPRRQAADEEFQRFRHSLQLQDGEQLYPSKSYETDELHLTLTFADRQALLDRWAKLREILA
ncbi:MAG: hypothetical protein CSA34_07895 [Desulfobulbus propionicus]|nr:MAG: hypothetical protein CSA34_07895 [Desulfobulbus propionicus]